VEYKKEMRDEAESIFDCILKLLHLSANKSGVKRNTKSERFFAEKKALQSRKVKLIFDFSDKTELGL